MNHWVPWAVCAAAALAAAVLLRRPLGAVGRLGMRTAVGLAGIWLFNQLGALIGMQVGVNLLTGMTVGLLGAPGFGLLLLLQCVL